MRLTQAITLVLVTFLVVCLNRAQTGSDRATAETGLLLAAWPRGVIFRVGSEVTEKQQVRVLTVSPALLPRAANQAAAFSPASLSHNVPSAFRRAHLAPCRDPSSAKCRASSANLQVFSSVWEAGRRKICHRNVSGT